MAKRKKRNQKQEIQEIMDSIARSESEYLKQQQESSAFSTSYAQPKYVTLSVDFSTGDSKIQMVETEEESAQIQAQHILRTLTENAIKAIEVIRDGKLAVDERMAKSGFKGISEKAVNSEPPKSAEFLAYLFLPKSDREVLLGDLTEEYRSVVAKFGQRRAQFYFYKQVVWSIWPLARKAFIKWGLFGWVMELIRRISS